VDAFSGGDSGDRVIGRARGDTVAVEGGREAEA
jgi:hypothetical protein